jgi:hypothetical protein
MDGQLALGIGLGILAISVPITALILVVMPRRMHHTNTAAESVVRDQERVRGVEIAAKGHEAIMDGVKTHLANIDGRLERIEKKIYE